MRSWMRTSGGRRGAGRTSDWRGRIWTTSVAQSRRAAIAHLRSGGLCIYPTETAYAVGCDATNARAVAHVFAVKGRARGKPLPLIVASSAMAWRYARPTQLARRLAQRYWPGPLTLVLAARRRLPHGGG